MKFSLKQIAIFDAIADTGSVSAAAARVAISQSAASMSLQQLEQQVGTLLFDRQGKRLVLNSWGLWLRPRAKALLQDVHQIEMGLNAKHSLSGKLQLSASQTVAESLIPSLISNLDCHFPQIQVKLQVKNSQQIIQDVRSFNIDLGVIEGRCDDSKINQELSENEFSFSELNKVKVISLGGGGLQILLTILLTTLLSLFTGWVDSPIQGVFLGAILSLSSTAVVLKSLMERNETETPHGQVMLGIPVPFL